MIYLYHIIICLVYHFHRIEEAMESRLYDTAESYFSLHPELIADSDSTMLYDKRDNPFLRSIEVNGRGYRSISERLVLLLIRHSENIAESILILPRHAVKAVLPAEKTIEMHRHRYFELFGVLDGQLEVRMEHATKRYLPGDFCLINRNVFHSEIYSMDSCAIYLSLRSDYFEEIMSCNDSKHYPVFTQFAKRNGELAEDEDSLDFSPVQNENAQRNIAQMESYIDLILKELIGRNTGYKDVVTGYLKRLFAHLQYSEKYTCVNTRYQTVKDSVCQELLKYIHQNRRKLSREELAAAIGYNNNYLADQFRKSMGISLSAYIRDICMQEAARQLLNTDCSVHEIIHSLGYENRTVFYQHFQEKYHMTPKEYRSSL